MCKCEEQGKAVQVPENSFQDDGQYVGFDDAAWSSLVASIPYPQSTFSFCLNDFCLDDEEVTVVTTPPEAEIEALWTVAILRPIMFLDTETGSLFDPEDCRYGDVSGNVTAVTTPPEGHDDGATGGPSIEEGG